MCVCGGGLMLARVSIMRVQSGGCNDDAGNCAAQRRPLVSAPERTELLTKTSHFPVANLFFMPGSIDCPSVT